jgi:hypothetical protein
MIELLAIAVAPHHHDIYIWIVLGITKISAAIYLKWFSGVKQQSLFTIIANGRMVNIQE